MSKERCLVTGAGGFIGGHLVKDLMEKGHPVTAVDIKVLDEWYQVHNADNWSMQDMSRPAMALFAAKDCSRIYNLAADMGGMGFISSNRIATLHSVDITSTMFKVAAENKARIFQASSACVYPDFKQQETKVSLKESDAWPADPEPCYGLEKLYGEEFAKWYAKEAGLVTRVARLHNVYGPSGTFDGGREKAPAAICRKVIEAKLSGNLEIEIWGDGEQTRSFMWIEDCIEGINIIMDGDYPDPLNLGSAQLVTINELVTIVEGIAGVKLTRKYDLSAPQGVRGRNSDNLLIFKTYDWYPTTPLETGMEATYQDIYDKMVS